MATLDFDPNQSFEDHSAALRKHLEGLDPELAAILSTNLDSLLGDGDATQARANRTAFNDAVVKELDKLLPKDGSA